MWIRTTERSWWRTTETSLGVSFETYLRRGGDVLMGCRHYVSLRRRHDIPLRLCEDVPLRRLGDVPLRRRWMFHLRRTCDVTGTYKKMSLRRGHDVLLPGGVAIFNWIFHLSNFWRTFLMFFKYGLILLEYFWLIRFYCYHHYFHIQYGCCYKN